MTTLMTAAVPAGAAAPGYAAVPPTAGGLPPGLTDADARRIAAAISAAGAESTRALYAHAWSQWTRWCAARGILALPGDPLALCAYLTARAEEGRAMGTLDLACVAIRHVHRLCAAADPVAAEAVRQVRLGLRRTHGTAPRRLARPLTLEEIRRIVASIDRTTPIGARDAAIILLGYASALRRSELVALTLADVEHRPAGLLLTVRRSKTDQQGHGQVVAVADARHALTDPVAALAAWRAVRGETPGALFTRIPAGSVGLAPLSGHVVAGRLRARRSRRTRGHPDQRPLPACRTRHHRRRCGRTAQPHRRSDPTQGHLRPRQPIHPSAGSTRDDVEQGPRPVTRDHPARAAPENQPYETCTCRCPAGTREVCVGVDC